MNGLPEITFQQVLEALLDADTPFPPRYLARFSDLEISEINQLAEIWPKIPAWRRKALLEDVQELGEKDTILSFDNLLTFALQDRDPQVRLPALRGLWDYESPRLVPTFLDLLSNDSDVQVRAAAAGGLGHYVYLGEVENLPKQTLQSIEERLLEAAKGNDQAEVRRSALEALGYSSKEEVGTLIDQAYQSGDREWVASALFAMGRSANERWRPQVKIMLNSQFPALRAEAARAAGELEMGSSIPRLLELLDDPDDQTRLASIWSLSQLGGENARKALERLYKHTDDEDERKFIDSALDNLTFNEELQLLPFLDFPEADDEMDDEFDDFKNALDEDSDWLDELNELEETPDNEELEELDELDDLEDLAELADLEDKDDEEEELA